ncbi:MAG: hypothetical protein N3A38_07960 [Planctomycetota bacterium]|nr:hypothetical protein [Planctomycetota bacterium]
MNIEANRRGGPAGGRGGPGGGHGGPAGGDGGGPVAAEAGPAGGGDAEAPGGKILKAGAAVLTAHVLFKLLSLILNRVIAQTYGAGDVSDAYAVAFTGVFILFFLIGEEAIGPAFLPLFIERETAGDEKGAWRFASIVANWQILILLAVTVAMAAVPDLILRVMTELEKSKPGAFRTASGFLRVMAPGLIAFSLATLTYMLLNGYKRFFWAAFGDGTMRIVTILFILAAGGSAMLGPDAISLGILAGCFAKLLTHIVPMRREIRNYRLTLDVRNETFRRFLVLVAPLLGGILFAKFRDFFNQVYVLSHVEEQGVIALHRWGKGIFDTIHYLVPYAISIAMFPFLCEITDRDGKEAMARVLGRSCRLLLWIFVPASACLAVVSEPLARGIYEGGRLDAGKAALIGMVNLCYCIGLPFYALETMVMRAFFSTRRMVAPVIIGVATSSLSMVASYWAVVVRGADGADALMAISLAFALSRVLKTLLLVFVLRLRLPLLPAREAVPFLAKLAVATAAALLAALAFRSLAGSGTVEALLRSLPGALRAMASRPEIRYLGEVAVCGAAGGAAFLAASFLLRMEELSEAVAFVRREISRRRGKR